MSKTSLDNSPSSASIETPVKSDPPRVLTQPSSPGDKIRIKELEKEIQDVKAQAKDWQEKTEALVAKRRQDREALKDAERNRIQLQQLEEFKGRIMEQHNDLKKELREERKRREDLADEFDAFRNGKIILALLWLN